MHSEFSFALWTVDIYPQLTVLTDIPKRNHLYDCRNTYFTIIYLFFYSPRDDDAVEPVERRLKVDPRPERVHAHNHLGQKQTQENGGKSNGP